MSAERVQGKKHAILARMMTLRTPRFHLALAICLVTALLSTHTAYAGMPPTPDRPPTTAQAPTDAPSTDIPATESSVPILTEADFRGLTTEEALLVAQPLPRDLADMALRLDPTLDALPQPFNDVALDHAVGDAFDFWVQNSSTAEFTQVVAELVHKTDVAYAWVEQGASYDADAIRAAVDQFSEVIYPAVRSAFGEEASPGVDNDPRVHILHATGFGPGVHGYFLGGDEYSSQVLPHSNQKEMFYMSLNWLNAIGYGVEYEEVLAHEFQHMIHHNHDETEQAWVNEGLSETAKEVAGYHPFSSFVMIFSNQSGTQLNDWGGANANNSAHYGAAFLFMHYLAQRFGDDILSEIVSEQANGLAGIEAVLERAPYSTTVDAVFADWVVANALNVETADADGVVRWGYPALPLLSIRPTLTVEAYPVEIDEEVNNFAADYILLGADGEETPRTLRFENRGGDSALTPVHRTLAADAGDRVWWSNRVDNSETRLTRHFDLSEIAPGTPVTATARMWFDIEPDYDYGYVMASADGTHWEILPGDYTTARNPSGMNLGDAYTGVAPESESPDLPVWVTDQFDLSAYAGGDLWLRFDYITDDAVTFPGWIVDEVAIPAIDYFDDMDEDASGWESEGWVLGDGTLAQRFLVQVVELVDGEIASVRQIPVDDEPAGVWDLGELTPDRELLITVSGMTDGTTEPALYSLSIE